MFSLSYQGNGLNVMTVVRLVATLVVLFFLEEAITIVSLQKGGQVTNLQDKVREAK